MTGAREPLERCGYTVHRSSSVLAEQLDMVRVAKDGWATYVTAEFYDDFAGDDEAFASLMDAWRDGAQWPTMPAGQTPSERFAAITKAAGLGPVPERIEVTYERAEDRRDD